MAVLGYMLIAAGLVAVLAGQCAFLIFVYHGSVGAILILLYGGIGIIASGFACVAISDRKKLPRDGTCHTCGYDLRGGHDHCPECGTPT